MSGSVTFNFSAPNLADFSALSIWFLLYFLFFLITLGYHFRQSRSQGRGGLPALIRGLVFGAIWPVYWLTVIGPAGTLSALSSAILTVRSELLFVYYSLALIFVPAFQIYVNWNSCSNFGSCSGTVIKAFLTGLVWPILLAAKIF